MADAQLRGPRSGQPIARVTGLVQSAYYLLTGLWPVVHLASFEWITGEKTDDWLVRTFGVLVAAIGLALIYATTRPGQLQTARVLGVSVAVALAVSETVAWATGAVGPIYLADAGLHAVIVAAWLVPMRGTGEPFRRPR